MDRHSNQTPEEIGELLEPTQQEPIFSTEPTDIVCDACGSFKDRHTLLGDQYIVCQPCSDKAVEAEKQAAQDAAIANTILRQEQARIAKIKDCNIGDRFIGMTFADYRPTCKKAEVVLTSCRDFVENFSPRSGAGLLMIGSPGTGKNMLAAIVCQEILARNFTALHTTALKLVRRIKDSWKSKGESEQDVINLFTSPGLLVIDEIGVQFGSSTEQLFINEVINDRYEKKAPTILISNLTMSQITESIGVRAVDRFYDDNSKILVFDWDSYRRRAS